VAYTLAIRGASLASTVSGVGALVGGLVKVKQTLLLVFTAYAAYVAGGGLSKGILRQLELVAISFTAVASVTAINMYFDRDIDAVMKRTRSRPLASGRIRPGYALAASLALLVASIIAGYRVFNIWYSIGIMVGFVFDIFAYTLLLKRRSPVNIVAGAVAGGAPALGGWAAATGGIDAAALLFSLIVAAWVPAHIWFLATFYRDDYERAGVPMLPVVADPSAVGAAIAIAAMATGYAIAALGLMRVIGLFTTLYGLAAAGYIMYLAAKYVETRGDTKYAKQAFVRVNMALGFFYMLVVLEKLVA
jgi:protoheme IX farnesyltransferase